MFLPGLQEPPQPQIRLLDNKKQDEVSLTAETVKASEEPNSSETALENQIAPKSSPRLVAIDRAESQTTDKDAAISPEKDDEPLPKSVEDSLTQSSNAHSKRTRNGNEDIDMQSNEPIQKRMRISGSSQEGPAAGFEKVAPDGQATTDSVRDEEAAQNDRRRKRQHDLEVNQEPNPKRLSKTQQWVIVANGQGIVDEDTVIWLVRELFRREKKTSSSSEPAEREREERTAAEIGILETAPPRKVELLERALKAFRAAAANLGIQSLSYINSERGDMTVDQTPTEKQSYESAGIQAAGPQKEILDKDQAIANPSKARVDPTISAADRNDEQEEPEWTYEEALKASGQAEDLAEPDDPESSKDSAQELEGEELWMKIRELMEERGISKKRAYKTVREENWSISRGEEQRNMLSKARARYEAGVFGQGIRH